MDSSENYEINSFAEELLRCGQKNVDGSLFLDMLSVQRLVCKYPDQAKKYVTVMCHLAERNSEYLRAAAVVASKCDELLREPGVSYLSVVIKRSQEINGDVYRSLLEWMSLDTDAERLN
jgi:hypothetical protein